MKINGSIDGYYAVPGLWSTRSRYVASTLTCKLQTPVGLSATPIDVIGLLWLIKPPRPLHNVSTRLSRPRPRDYVCTCLTVSHVFSSLLHPELYLLPHVTLLLSLSVPLPLALSLSPSLSLSVMLTRYLSLFLSVSVLLSLSLPLSLSLFLLFNVLSHF